MEKYRLVEERKVDRSTGAGSAGDFTYHPCRSVVGTTDDFSSSSSTPASATVLSLQSHERGGGRLKGGEGETEDQRHHRDPATASLPPPQQSHHNEIRITQQGKPRNYITYAMGLFTEHGADRIVLKAMGRAVNKAVTIAEIIKRKAPLHQITSIDSCELVDVFEPLEEGLDRVESRRYVSCMTIVLSKSPLDQKHIGYQVCLVLMVNLYRFFMYVSTF